MIDNVTKHLQQLEIVEAELDEMAYNVSQNPTTALVDVVADLRRLADWIEAGMPDNDEVE